MILRASMLLITPMVTGFEIAAIASGFFGSTCSIAVAYLVFKGGDRASQRTTEVQQQQNGVDGLATLTQEQRTELVDTRNRLREAEAHAAQAKTSASEAHKIAEQCQLQQAVLTQAYRDLYEWASQPCPHEHPPPPPPLRVAVGL